MTRRTRSAAALLVGASLAAGFGGALWWSRDAAPPEPVARIRPAPAALPPAAAPEARTPGVARATPPRPDRALSEAAEPPFPDLDDPFGDLAYYEAYPMSPVPHRVVRGWGVGPRSTHPGRVGALVVVEPSIDAAALTALVRDIREYHRGAEAVAIRILDSMQAATYDRHDDGGEQIARHLVGRIQRNDRLGIDEASARGAEVAGASPPESAPD